MSASAIIVPSPDQVLAVARHPHDLADGFRAMQNILGLSNAWLDEAGDFGDEQIGKFLGPSYAKKIGPFTFQMLCSLLAVEWRMHVDIDRVCEMEKLWEARKPQYVQPRSRPPSRDIVERAKPHVMKDFSKLGNDARKLLLPREQQLKIARKAAKARARLPKAKRSEISRKGWEKRRVNKHQANSKEHPRGVALADGRDNAGKGDAVGRTDTRSS
jgi:hypothetical protein